MPRGSLRQKDRHIDCVPRKPVGVNFEEIVFKPTAYETPEDDIYEPLQEVLGDNPNKVTYTYIKQIRFNGKRVPEDYIVLSDAQVYSTLIDEFLSIYKHEGYMCCTLDINGKRTQVRVSVLVALHFIVNPDPKKKIWVDHIDGDPNNNKISNLRWATPPENRKNRAVQTTSHTPVLRYDMDEKFIDEYPSIIAGARETRSNEKSIRRCLTEEYDYAWSKDGKRYVWRYKFPREKQEVPEGSVPVLDFETYMISLIGELYSLTYNRFITPFKHTPDGHVHVHLYKNNICYEFPVHELMGENHLENRPEDYKDKSKWIVNHKNGFKDDNRKENLEYTTSSRNSLHATYVLRVNGAKYVNMVDVDTREVLKTYPSISMAAKRMGVKPSTISAVLRGERPTCRGHGWEYATEENMLEIDMEDLEEYMNEKEAEKQAEKAKLRRPNIIIVDSDDEEEEIVPKKRLNIVIVDSDDEVEEDIEYKPVVVNRPCRYNGP